MKKDKDTSADAVELRRRAMERLKAQGTDEESMRTEKYALRMLHELQVHQIELEMQNEALQQSQAESEASLRLYTDLYDFAPVGYFTLDRACAIRQVNLIGAQLVGAECSRLIGAHFGFFVSPETRPIFNDFLQSVFDSHSVKSCEVVIQTKTSSQFYARIEASISRNSEECRIAVISLNIEKQLEKSEERFRTLANLSPVGIYLCDTEGRCQYANLCWCEMAGMSQEEALGEGWVKALHPEDRASVFSAWQQMVESEGRWGLEYRFLTPAGKVTWVRGLAATQHNAEGEIVGYVGINMDITERKLAEERLAEFNQILEGILEHTYIMVAYLDTKFDITWVNRAFARSSHHDSFLLRGKHYFDIYPGEGNKKVFQRVVDTGEPFFATAEPYGFPNQPERNTSYLDWSLIPVKTARGKVSGLVLTLVDVTDRIKSEEELGHSHDLLSYIIEHTRSAIAVYDRDLKYIYVSRQYLDEYKIKEMDIIGKHHYDVFPNLPQKWKDVHQRALAGEAVSAEDDIYENEDGSVDWTTWECRPWYEADGSIGGIVIYTEVITKRKLEENILWHNQAMLARTESIAHIGSWEWDVETDTVTWSNELFRIFRREPADGAPSFTEHSGLFHPEDLARLQHAVDIAISDGTPYEVELRAIRADGETRVCLSRGYPEIDPAENTVRLFGSFQDITERKLSEEALRESEERFFNAFEYAAIGKALVSPEGRWIRVNKSLCEIVGFSTQELMTKTFQDITHPDDLDSDLEYVRQMLAGDILTYQMEKRYIHKQGHIVWVLLSVSLVRDSLGKPMYFISQIQDINERKKAEEHLANSEYRFRLLFEQAPLGIALIDSLTGHIFAVNPRYAEIAGRTMEQMATIDWMSITHPDDVQADLDQMALLNAGEIPGFQMEKRYLRPDGSIVWINMTISPMRLTDAVSPRHLCTIDDITNRKHSEAVLQARLHLSEFSATHSLDELLQRMMDEAELLTGSAIGFLHFVDEDQKSLTLQMWSTNTLKTMCTAEGKGQHYSVELAGVWVDCLIQGRPVIHNDYAGLLHRKGLPEGHALVVRELLIPIIRNNIVVAIIGVGNKPLDYTYLDVETLNSLADLTWEIVERKKAEKALEQAAERDHHIAEVLQQTVMPSLTSIQLTGYDIATKYKPALQEADVGGDFCDIFNLGVGRIGLTIGDVTGDGLSAALHVSSARHSIRCCAFTEDRPSSVMSLVNDILCRDIVTESDMLTAFFAVLDTRTGQLTYCNAGHEPPLLWHSKSAEYLAEGGPMFIGMGKQTYLEGTVRLDAEDTLVLVTDGITEACIDFRSGMFGSEGVVHSVSRNAGLSAEQIADGILKDAESFAGGRLRDDVTIVVLKKL